MYGQRGGRQAVSVLPNPDRLVDRYPRGPLTTGHLQVTWSHLWSTRTVRVPQGSIRPHRWRPACRDYEYEYEYSLTYLYNQPGKPQRLNSTIHGLRPSRNPRRRQEPRLPFLPAYIDSFKLGTGNHSLMTHLPKAILSVIRARGQRRPSCWPH